MSVFRIMVVIAFSVATWVGAQAQEIQRRVALVIGQGAYSVGALPLAVNDAGLVAQTLADSGFEVVEGRDLDTDGTRQLVREFLDRAEKAGRGAMLAVYASGYAAQLEGENYLLPVNAKLTRASDMAISGFRMSDLVRSLSALPASARFVIIDAPFQYPGMGDKTIAPGLALVEPLPGFLVAYSSAPGMTIPVVSKPDEPAYGVYARALVEQMRQPGLDVDDVFKRVRLQVHEETKGVQIPWHATALKEPFQFFSTEGQAPLTAERAPSGTAEEAYSIAVERDTIAGYQEFLRSYPDDPLSRRVQVLLANRREAVVWNRTVTKDTAEAYWSYLKFYSRGPHAEDARRRLVMLSRPSSPPERFDVVIYDDLPPPLPAEIIYQETYIYNDYRDYYSYPSPPPVPVFILPPRESMNWRPPVAPVKPGFLPAPPPMPLPSRALPAERIPPRVAPIAPVYGSGRPPADIGRLPRPGQEDLQGGHPSEQRRPVKRPLSPPAQTRPIERPAPPVERVRPVERPSSPPVQTRPMERPSPPPQPVRPVERPSPPPAQARPVERPSPPVERARPVERPSPPPQPLRPVERPSLPPAQARPVERPSSPPAHARPIERPAPPVERARPAEQRPAERAGRPGQRCVLPTGQPCP